jgi:hypothetical protein
MTAITISIVWRVDVLGPNFIGPTAIAVFVHFFCPFIITPIVSFAAVHSLPISAHFDIDNHRD